ncbi:hypothetical protein Ancab_040024 [Ancistrocladus abbreviatus]
MSTSVQLILPFRLLVVAQDIVSPLKVSSTPIEPYQDWGEYNIQDEMEELIGGESNHENQEGDVHVSNLTPSASGTEEHDDTALKKQKRPKTSKVWLKFNVVELSDKTKKAECIHCKKTTFYHAKWICYSFE